jgi:hypothetical protein
MSGLPARMYWRTLTFFVTSPDGLLRSFTVYRWSIGGWSLREATSSFFAILRACTRNGQRPNRRCRQGRCGSAELRVVGGHLPVAKFDRKIEQPVGEPNHSFCRDAAYMPFRLVVLHLDQRFDFRGIRRPPGAVNDFIPLGMCRVEFTEKFGNRVAAFWDVLCKSFLDQFAVVNLLSSFRMIGEWRWISCSAVRSIRLSSMPPRRAT